MNFSILIHEAAEVFARRDDPAQRPALFAPIGEYLKALRDAGVFVDGAGLEAPTTAIVLSANGNGWKVQDGPFADSKEQRSAGSGSRAIRACGLAWRENAGPIPAPVRDPARRE